MQEVLNCLRNTLSDIISLKEFDFSPIAKPNAVKAELIPDQDLVI